MGRISKYEIRNLFYQKGWSVRHIVHSKKVKEDDVLAAIKIYNHEKT